MTNEDLFKTMCTIANAHGDLVRGAQVLWANEDEDSFITGERKADLEQSDPGDQRIAERHPNPLIALTPMDPPQGSQDPASREAAIKALEELNQWVFNRCPGGPWRAVEPLGVLFQYLKPVA